MSTNTDFGGASYLPLPSSADAIEIILKLPGEACNLNCSYCYEKRQPSVSTGFIEEPHIRQLAAQLAGRKVSIGLHGGEPLLLGKKRMRALLSAIDAHLNVSDIKLQTNGVLVDEEWIDIFRSSPRPVTIGISHDGPRHLSLYRVDYAAKNKAAAAQSAIEALCRAHVPIGVICVISAANLDAPEELVSFFSAFESVKTVNFVPCFDHGVQSRELDGPSGELIRRWNPSQTSLPKWAITPLQFLEFLRRVWASWRDHPTFIIEPFVSVIRSISGKRPESCDFTDEKCGHVLTLYPDGRVTTCDEFESAIADLGVALFEKQQETFVDANKWKKVSKGANSHLRKCQECSHRSTCRGGCIATRERYNGTRYYEDYCTYKKELIDFVSDETRRL